jgi:hypothetical protein
MARETKSDRRRAVLDELPRLRSYSFQVELCGHRDNFLFLVDERNPKDLPPGYVQENKLLAIGTITELVKWARAMKWGATNAHLLSTACNRFARENIVSQAEKEK